MFSVKRYYQDSLYRNAMAILVSTASLAAFGVFFWIVAARTLPVNEVGLATAAISAGALLLTVLRVGLDSGYTRFFPQSNDKRSFFSAYLYVTLVLSLLPAIVFLVGLSFFSPALLFLRQGWFLPAFVLFIGSTSVIQSQNQAMITIRRSDFYLVQNLLLGLRVPLLFAFSLGTLGVFCSLDIASVIACIYGAYVLARKGLALQFRLDLSPIRNMLTYSIGVHIASILAVLPATIVPVMIVNVMGANASAYFYVAYSIAGVLLMIVGAVSFSLFVEGSHDVALRENVIKAVKFTLLFLIPAVIVVVLFGDKLLLIFGQVYSNDALTTLQLLALSSLFAAVTSIYISIKKVQKELRVVNGISLAICVLTIGLGYLLLVRYGLTGLAVGWLFSNAVICSIILWLIVWRDKWVDIRRQATCAVSP